MSNDLVANALKKKVCENCHNAHVSAKIVLGDGADAEVLWVCRVCTLELQKHDEDLTAQTMTTSEAHQQGEFKTDDLEKLFLTKTGKKINQKVNDVGEHYQTLIAAQGLDQEGNAWNCVDIEFNFVEYVTGISLEQLKDCLLPQNQPKNRYANVVAPDPTRVRLSIVDTPTSDYINANWVPGRVPNSERRYICAQGPLPTTVEDFWRMVYECKVAVIAMLTQEIEAERVKCEHYWPDAQTPAIAYGSVTVRFVQEDATPEVTTRYFDLSHAQAPQAIRRVTQYQYTEWPDFGQPASCDAFLKLTTAVDEANHTKGPLLVHCSAGIGRTGTFVVVHTVLEEYKYYHAKKLPLTFNLIEVLIRIRGARPGLVQTKDQLQFCYRALSEAISTYNSIHGPPAKVRAVKVKPLPPSTAPPATVLAAAAKVDIVPYTKKEKSDSHFVDTDESSSDSDDHYKRRRDRERERARPHASGGRRRRDSDKHRRHGGARRSGSGRRDRGSGTSSPARGHRSSGGSASPSVLEQALAEAKAEKRAASGNIYLDV